MLCRARLCYNITVNNFSTAPTRAILDRLSSPDNKLKIIHIAGTNGKGSTAEFFTNILIAAKKRVGTFTSPEVYSYNGQFKTDGAPLSDGQIEKYFGAAKKAAEGVGASDFETETAGAVYAFAEEGCEYAVIECGMGGLTDATNAVKSKVLAVITSISLEHTQYLGGTIEEICAQKAGIIKDCPVVVNARQSAEAKKYFKKAGAYFAAKKLCDGFEVKARGSLQPYNAATAIAGARILKIPESAIYEGIKNTAPDGRVEVLRSDGREYILDGAHNPAAFAPLCAYLKGRGKKNVTAIYGCLSDKDVSGCVGRLSRVAEKIIAVPTAGPRAVSAEAAADICRRYFKEVKAAESVSAALDTADTQTVAVCGSFTILKEAKLWIEKRL